MLLKCTAQAWLSHLAAYQTAIQCVEQRKEGVENLDDWKQTLLPKLIKARSPPLLLHEDLAQLMKWKLKRGKFRPRLFNRGLS